VKPVYAAFVGSSVLIAIAAATLSARRAGLAVGRFVLLETCFGIVGLLGAKLFALAEVGSAGLGRDAVLGPGLRYPGGIVAVLLATPFLRRWLLPEVTLAGLADVCAPSIGFAMAVVRFGCLAAGCCLGVSSLLPWAIRFPPDDAPWRWLAAAGLLSTTGPPGLPVHPLPLYFALLSAGAGFYALRLQSRKAFDGAVLLWFLVIHETGKFLLEFLRAAPWPSVLPLQATSLGLAALAGGILLARAGALGASHAGATPRPGCST
jgi:phosphatidylglycerol:prolipoprotein diacylglycerol transferase